MLFVGPILISFKPVFYYPYNTQKTLMIDAYFLSCNMFAIIVFIYKFLLYKSNNTEFQYMFVLPSFLNNKRVWKAFFDFSLWSPIAATNIYGTLFIAV